MTRYVVVDTEATGLADDADIIEIAAVAEDKTFFHELIHTDKTIDFDAMGAHHITPAMLEDARPRNTVYQRVDSMINGRILVAHFAQFDKKFFPPHMEWICTYKCARHIFPDMDSYKNQTLRYALGVDVTDMPAEAGGLAHRALYDAWVTYKIFQVMLDEYSLDDLLTLTQKPVLLKKVGFGKHGGELWSEVPKSYLRWVTKQDFDEDVMYTANHYLE